MIYYGNNDWRDYLAHHGILGMKWGHRNGPPYPLGAEDHSAAEKKAGWRKSLSSTGADPARRKHNNPSKNSGDVKKNNEPTPEEKAKKQKEVKEFVDDLSRAGDGGVVKGKHVKKVKELYDSLSTARKDYDDAHQIAKDYFNLSDKERSQFVIQAADYNFAKLKKENPDDRSWTKEAMRDWYLYDDGDQGEHNSFYYYAKSRGSSYDREVKKSMKAKKAFDEAAKKAVDEYLGESKNTPVKGVDHLKYYPKTVGDLTLSMIDDLRFDDDLRRNAYIPD